MHSKESQGEKPAFLAMNPAGQVPVAILADGRPLAQSNAIILHLAEQVMGVVVDSVSDVLALTG